MADGKITGQELADGLIITNATLSGTTIGQTVYDTDDSTKLATTEFVKQYNSAKDIITGNYSIVLADVGKVIQSNNLADSTITIPTNATTPFPVGTQITFIRWNTPEVSIVNSVGVTLVSSDGKRRINKQYESATLLKTDGDEWVLIGALKT